VSTHERSICVGEMLTAELKAHVTINKPRLSVRRHYRFHTAYTCGSGASSGRFRESRFRDMQRPAGVENDFVLSTTRTTTSPHRCADFASAKNCIDPN
jgi:hypothetical protein